MPTEWCGSSSPARPSSYDRRSGLAHEHEYDTVRLAPLLEALTADHIVAALLVRLGGYAVGVFDGEPLFGHRNHRLCLG